MLAVLTAAPVPAAAQSLPSACSGAVLGTTFSGSCSNNGQTINVVCTGASGAGTCTFSGACTGSMTRSPSGAITSNVMCSSSAAQTIGTIARQASQVSMTAVQEQLTNVRDNAQRRLQAASGRPLGYADGSQDDAEGQSLGYADSSAHRLAANPLYAKAPQPAPAQTSGVSTWSQLYGDYEERRGLVDGFDTGRITRTGGLIAGLDKVFPNALGSDALVLGLLTSNSVTHVVNADGSTSHINGPGVGAYGIWINGPWSIDATGKVDFLSIEQSAAGVITDFGLTNFSGALNLNRKIEFTGWWIEPTAGLCNTASVWNSAGHALGLTDGNDLRVQAGTRFGTTFEWGRASVDATLTTVAYDDVSITGGTLVTATGASPLVPTDEGKIFGQAIGKLNFDWSKDIKGLSSYLESEIRGRSGVLGLAERVGVRYSW